MNKNKTVVIFLCKKTGALDFLLANLICSSFEGEIIVKTYNKKMFIDLKNNSKSLFAVLKENYNIKIKISFIKIRNFEKYLSFFYYKIGNNLSPIFCNFLFKLISIFIKKEKTDRNKTFYIEWSRYAIFHIITILKYRNLNLIPDAPWNDISGYSLNNIMLSSINNKIVKPLVFDKKYEIKKFKKYVNFKKPFYKNRRWNNIFHKLHKKIDQNNDILILCTKYNNNSDDPENSNKKDRDLLYKILIKKIQEFERINNGKRPIIKISYYNNLISKDLYEDKKGRLYLEKKIRNLGYKTESYESNDLVLNRLLGTNSIISEFTSASLYAFPFKNLVIVKNRAFKHYIKDPVIRNIFEETNLRVISK